MIAKVGGDSNGITSKISGNWLAFQHGPSHTRQIAIHSFCNAILLCSLSTRSPRGYAMISHEIQKLATRAFVTVLRLKALQFPTSLALSECKILFKADEDIAHCCNFIYNCPLWSIIRKGIKYFALLLDFLVFGPHTSECPIQARTTFRQKRF